MNCVTCMRPVPKISCARRGACACLLMKWRSFLAQALLAKPSTEAPEPPFHEQFVTVHHAAGREWPSTLKSEAGWVQCLEPVGAAGCPLNVIIYVCRQAAGLTASRLMTTTVRYSSINQDQACSNANNLVTGAPVCIANMCRQLM